MHRRWYTLATCAVIAIVASSHVNAHPHAWIDVEVQVQFDTSARVAALRMTWLFDEIYSAYVTQGLMFKGTGNTGTQQTGRILAVLMKNLARFHYMTWVESGNKQLQFGVPSDAAIDFKGRRLELIFTLPLTNSVSAREMPITYSIYDPSYYIEMLHAENKKAIRLVNAPADCHYVLKPPHPDPAQVEKAAALDRTQSAGNGLGIFFAERVTLRCAGQH